MEHYKIVVLGKEGVGKTSLTMQFVSGIFMEYFDPTIEDLYVKKVRINDEEKVVEILDTAGCDQISYMRDLYIKNADGLMIVYNILNENSFRCIINLQDYILQIKKCYKVPIVLVGNKVDEAHSCRQVYRASGEDLARSWGCSFFETSAKRNVAVNDAFSRLIEGINLFTARNFKSRVSIASKKTCHLL